jgi:hypothetical protein
MRSVPDWQIQAAWWASGIFATGAAWYFLSTNNVTFAVISAVLALLFAGAAILLHRKKDELAAIAGGDERGAHQRANEVENADEKRFERLSKLMPDLFAELRRDLCENRELMLREFVILPNERIRVNHGQPRIEVFETKHPAAKNQVGILVSEGLVEVVRSSDTPIYRLTEALVERLERAA